MSAVLELDASQRGQIFARPMLGATMRAIDARRTLSPEWRAEVWRWVMWLQASRGLAVVTIAAYAATLGAFADWLSPKSINYADVPLTVIDEWQKHLWFFRRNGSGRRAYALSALKSFYDWRQTRGLGRNCTAGAMAPRKVYKTPRKYTKKQLQQLFIASRKGMTELVSKRDETLLAMLYATGMRREEVAHLRLDQVEIDNRIAVLRIFGKGSKEREVTIEGPAVTLLRNWLAERANHNDIISETVFFSVRRNWWGLPMGPKTVERAVRSVAKRAGLGDWGVHRFRVTFATQLYDDGVDLERIRILLGHSTIETTRRYLSVSNRMRMVRLKAFRQHEVFGTRPEGMPLWAQKMGERSQ